MQLSHTRPVMSATFDEPNLTERIARKLTLNGIGAVARTAVAKDPQVRRQKRRDPDEIRSTSEQSFWYVSRGLGPADGAGPQSGAAGAGRRADERADRQGRQRRVEGVLAGGGHGRRRGQHR